MLGALTYHWIITQSRLREIEVKIVMLEEKLQHVEKIDDRIYEKLESISEQINEIKISLNNKQDKL